jgi:hypothetical protein
MAQLETAQDLKAQLAALKAQLATAQAVEPGTPRDEIRAEREQQSKEIAGLMDTLAQMGVSAKPFPSHPPSPPLPSPHPPPVARSPPRNLRPKTYQ